MSRHLITWLSLCCNQQQKSRLVLRHLPNQSPFWAHLPLPSTLTWPVFLAMVLPLLQDVPTLTLVHHHFKRTLHSYTMDHVWKSLHIVSEDHWVYSIPWSRGLQALDLPHQDAVIAERPGRELLGQQRMGRMYEAHSTVILE